LSRFLGDIRQNGYVVRDIEAAMTYWTEVMGVGPWLYLDRAPIQDFHYRGTPSDLEVSIALSNDGPLQIELIQQRNDAPSMYRDFLNAGHEGLQHVAYWTEDFDTSLAEATARGLEIGQSGYSGSPDGRFVYFTAEAHPGTVIELSEISGAKGQLFRRIRERSAAWDGENPIRRL
jgi:catechol 2,3-dioxygenase-like lactoylglutathione lyase family enzyme